MCLKTNLVKIEPFQHTMESNIVTASSDLEPHEQMEFDSHDAAYEFYKEYAKSLGFGTAKLSSRRSRASKEFIDAKFSCIRYGNKQQSDDAINPRPSPKIGCKASLHVKRKPNGKWYVYSFVKEHNHELLPAQAHFFRSHRDIDPLKNDVRIRRRKILAGVSNEFSVYHHTIDHLDNVMRNQHDKGRSLSIEAGDARMLLELFMHMQEQDPKFFYAVDMNEEHRLRNVFWVDAKGMNDYTYFGDVVSLDTTYFTNKYKIPLVLFIGVNHHIQPTLFGCALIADETVYTFDWLIHTWLIAMGGRPPRVILTDQNSDLKEAIAGIIPESRHCFVLYHILDKIPRQLEYLSLWFDNFIEKFNKCIYQSWTENQFEKRWWKLLDKFKLQEDAWVKSLYEDRSHWVPFFMKGMSFAGLSSATRSECLNASFDKYVSAETSLREFLDQYKVLLEDQYEELAKSEFDSWHETPELRTPSPFEKQICWVYTHEIFKKFQVEVLGAAACHLKKENEDEACIVYAVKDFENNQDFVVEWNELKMEISCSCRLFEYQGYLCRHAIIVLQMSGKFSIPIKYILQRWTNAAFSRHPITERLDEVQDKVRRYNDLCRRAIILGEEGSISQESYNVALSAMKEALQQCASVNSSLEKDLRPDNSLDLGTASNEGDPVMHSAVGEKRPDPRASDANKVPRRAQPGKEVISNENNATTRGGAVGFQDVLPHVEIPSMRPAHLHNMFPVHFHNVMPSMFQATAPSPQFSNEPHLHH